MRACITLSGGMKCCIHFFKLKLACKSRKITSHLLYIFDSVKYFENLVYVTIGWPSAALGSTDILGFGCQECPLKPRVHICPTEPRLPVVSPPSQQGQETPRNIRRQASREGYWFQEQIIFKHFKLAYNCMQFYKVLLCNNILQWYCSFCFISFASLHTFSPIEEKQNI